VKPTVETRERRDPPWPAREIWGPCDVCGCAAGRARLPGDRPIVRSLERALADARVRWLCGACLDATTATATPERVPAVLDEAFVRRHSRALGRILTLLVAHGFTADPAPRLELSEILFAYGREEHEAARQ
jgi:hypothetical protein